jgi:thioredoxin reductase (NADPH)
MNNIYDVLIIGGGPAGLTAAVYCARYKLNTKIITDSFGGTMSEAHKVCNFPGFTEISGMDLTKKMIDQVKSLDVEIDFDGVVDIQKDKDYFIVNCKSQALKSKKIILAIGRKRRKLGLEREDELLGKGISYCATCDANFYKNKIVGVVGGSDAAVTAALLLSDIAQKVYLVYRKDKLRATPMWVDLLNKKENVEVLYNTEITKLLGESNLEQIETTTKNVEINGLFIEIGSIPQKEFLEKINIKVDKNGYIVVDDLQKTTVYGVYAAGDATTTTELKQIITACSQGAVAAYNIYKEIKE